MPLLYIRRIRKELEFYCSDVHLSMNSFLLTAILSVVGSSVLLLALFGRFSRSSLPYPPGPAGEWVFGNARQIPAEKQWITFAQWTEKYGGYIFLKIFRSPYLVINSPKAAMDLLEKKSNIYSDRPVSTMAMELIGWHFTSSLVPYNNLWRRHRKLLHQSLNVRDLANHRHIQVDEVNKFLPRVVENPNHIIEDVKRLTGSIIMRMAYGYDLKKDDNYVDLVEHAVEGLTVTFGVGFLVDIIPEWVPGAEFKRLAKKWRASTEKVVELPWAAMKEKYVCKIVYLDWVSKLFYSVS